MEPGLSSRELVVRRRSPDHLRHFPSYRVRAV